MHPFSNNSSGSAHMGVRLSIKTCEIDGLQVLLDAVFDRPVDSGPRVIRHSRGQLIADPGPHGDIEREMWWTFGKPVESDSTVDEAFFFEWLSHRDSLEHSRVLFLTDVPIDRDLFSRFGVDQNVLSVRPGRSTYVLVGFADEPSHWDAVSRLQTAASLFAA